MPPMHTGLQYGSWNDCMIAGYEQSLEFLKASGPEQINKNELYVKFVCLENSYRLQQELRLVLLSTNFPMILLPKDY